MLLKNFHAFVNCLALAWDANLKLTIFPIIIATNRDIFVLNCIDDGVAYQVVAYLNDSHPVSNQSVRH